MGEGKAMSFSRYAIFWEVCCDRRGWDYEDSPDEHWDELTEQEQGRLEQLWHEEGLD